MSEPNITMSPALNLSLYNLDEELRGLLEFREERISDRESPPDAEELAAIDGEIARYMEALPKKVSGVCAVLRSWRATREAASAEIKRLKGIVDHFDAMETRLKDICASVMEKMPEPEKGSRRLNGADGSSLMLKKNGGMLPLTITDESMLPDECCRMEGWIRADVWEWLVNRANAQFDDGDCSLTRIPDNEAIRAKLAEPCQPCHGVGAPWNNSASVPCDACGGTGKNAVPGAYLGPRGTHIEVR